MSLWRYEAVPLAGGPQQSGEAQGDSAAKVRARLRGVGLQVLSIKPVSPPKKAGGGAWSERVASYLRGRRAPHRVELYDGLSTLIDSGSTLLHSLDTLSRSQPRKSKVRALLLQLMELLRSGGSLSTAMEQQPSWFGPVEVAMVAAGENSGSLGVVLRSLADREQKSGELSQKLTGALAYPAVIAFVGTVAVLFLSLKTLPDLVSVLSEAGVETPALTARVMAIGQGLARYAPLLLVGSLLAIAAVLAIPRLLQDRPEYLRLIDRLTPNVLRKLALAGFASRLAEMLRSGVGMVEALRVLSPTTSHRALRAHLLDAARRVEAGEELSEAMHDPRWFDPEFQRLLDVGQQSGDLDSLLERLAARYERKARRLIDRLASLLEPAVILGLSILIGFVVMAAVLPMVRLQEVLA